MAEPLSVERLRAYLQDLKPEARAMLLGRLARGSGKGQTLPGGDLVLAALRRALGDGSGMKERYLPERMFFAPLEPFLIDADDPPCAGRVSRAVLQPLWQWIGRDLMPAEAAAYVRDFAACADDKERTHIVRSFQDLFVRRSQDAIVAAAANENAYRRFAGQLATPRPLDDLRAVAVLLKARDPLAAIGARLPPHIRNLADEPLASVKSLLDSPLARPAEVFVYALALVLRRLVAPWQLVRLAVKAADSDIAERIFGTPYAPAVTVVLGEVGRMVAALRRDIKRGQFSPASARLKALHDTVRMLRTEVDLSGDSPWSRELAGLRTAASQLLKAEIEPAPGRVRRLLRQPPAHETSPAAPLDAADVAETEALLEFVHACRHYASELAINEVALRVHADIETFLDTSTSLLLDALRAAKPAERAFRASQADAAARFAGKIFGPGYASLLAKAADVARKAERAGAAEKAG
jgi:hypothetical protein